MSEEFNWVERRAECSIVKVFAELEMGVKSDVETKNRVKPQTDETVFHFISSTERFKVIRDTKSRSPQSVEFSRTEGTIVVERNGKKLLKATLTLNADGECRLKVGGKELEQWQFRRVALEELLFD